MSAFTVFSSDCILLNNLTDSWGGRGRGAGPHLKSAFDGQTLRPPEEAQGGRGREVGNDRPKAGTVLYTSKAYISSEQNNSFYFMQKFEVECMFQKPSLAGVRVRHTQTRRLEKLGAGWTRSPRRGRGRHLGASSPEMHSIFVLFVNTSG